MKIYTTTGDGGETGLFGGARVPKDSARIAAIGDADELNAHLGLALTALTTPNTNRFRDVVALLTRIQGELFELGADLATPLENEASEKTRTRPIPRVSRVAIQALERAIDTFDAETPALRSFILPGGSPTGALVHVARTVCRRAERSVVALSHLESVNPQLLEYLNRLSDLLFVLARVVNHRAGAEETAWLPAKENA